jgi:pimeloyl-ACP methyl ester carboxylesterase
MQFNSVDVDGIDVFFREAGRPGFPQLLLLHDFPSSSHQYRNLMRALDPHFHVIAPDYPGFGASAMPPREEYSYTFDKTSAVMEAFLQRVGFTRFGLYLHGCGAPIGFRILLRRPEWLHWLVIQNANAYPEGFAPAWDGLRREYWKSREPRAEEALLPFLELETLRTIYTHGHKHPHRISPDNWNMDAYLLQRPGARQVQLDLLYDDRTNVALYPKWQAFLRKHQPRTLVFWGQNDFFLTPQGGEAYLRDLADAEIHRLETGHFALEDHLDYISRKMIDFNEAVQEQAWAG